MTCWKNKSVELKVKKLLPRVNFYYSCMRQASLVLRSSKNYFKEKSAGFFVSTSLVDSMYIYLLLWNVLQSFGLMVKFHSIHQHLWQFVDVSPTSSTRFQINNWSWVQIWESPWKNINEALSRQLVAFCSCSVHQRLVR